MTTNVVKAAIKEVTAENQFTDWISPTDQVQRTDPGIGWMNLSVSGTFVATVTLQRRFQGGTAVDVETYTTGTEKSIVDYEPGVEYRAGVKTGGFTSATGGLTLRLSKQGAV